MNKNFIRVQQATMFGVFLGGSLILSNPQLDLYNTNPCIGKSAPSKLDNKIDGPTILQSNFNTITFLSVLSAVSDEDELILREFVVSIMKNSKPLDGDFSALIDDNFWDLV